MWPRGNEPSGSRSNVVEGWIAGVTAPVVGSTWAPACTATVSILMTSFSFVRGAQHDAIFRPPRQRHARLARQRGGARVRHIHPERPALDADLQPHDRAEERHDVDDAVEAIRTIRGRRIGEHHE